MPGIDPVLSDEEYLIMRANEAQKYNIHSAKAWMLTAKTLFPANSKIQFEAYVMEKQSGNVLEAAESFSSLIMSRQNITELLPEISAIANALKSNEANFLSQMFDKINPDIQLTILKTSVENSGDTMELCRLLVLLLKKFPQLGVDSLVKTLINADKFFYDGRYARLLVVETLPLLTSLESPRLLQRLLIKAIDFYNNYVHDESENDISDPWQRLFNVVDLLGRQLGWDPYFVTYSNTLNKESYLQKLATLRNSEDCRQLLFCGTVFLLRSLYEEKSSKGNHVLVESLTDPDIAPSQQKISDVEVTGISSPEFQAAVHCWELLHGNEIITREFNKLVNQLQVKSWAEGFTDEVALFSGRYDKAMPPATSNTLTASLVKASIYYQQKNHQACVENILVTLNQLPTVEGTTETDLIVGGSHRHLHFLPLTRTAIMHYICTLLIRMLLSSEGSDLVQGHIIVLLQLGWPQEEAIFANILENIKKKGSFQYHLFPTYVILIDILEEFSYLWNDSANNVVLDVIPTSQQHLGQRRISTRGADKGVKEDFRQAMRAQVSRSNDDLLSLITQFIMQERAFFMLL